MNPSSPLRTSVSRWRSPWTLPAPVLENEAMTMRAPASIARSYGARWMRVEASRRRRRSRPGRWRSRRVVDVPQPCRHRRRSASASRPRRSGAARSAPCRPRMNAAPELGRRAPDPRRSPRRSGPSARPAGPRRPARSPSGCRSPTISTAVARPMRSTRSASPAAPSPTLCGKIVAPTTLSWPWTASTPYRIGMPSRVASAACWKPSTIAYQPSASFGSGAPPPPLRTEPRSRSATPGRSDRALLELGHLADLLVDRHLGEEGRRRGPRAAGSGRASRSRRMRSGSTTAAPTPRPRRRRRPRGRPRRGSR